MIRIRGARQHHLKNIDLDLPRNRLIVITGLSGSGKTSLALHTLYAEGQRRYVESLSSYARQFLQQFEKPEVDSIEGLSPAIAIEQRSGSGNPRSTIATVTEVYDYLRILYAAAGVPHDPETGDPLEKMGPADIVRSLQSLTERSKVILLAPYPAELGHDPGFANDLRRQGFVRIRVNGELFDLEEEASGLPEEINTLEVVVDRLVVKAGISSRLADSVETTLQLSGSEAKALVQHPGSEEWEELSFYTSYRHSESGFEMPALTPKHFSFNSHLGACQNCQGLGVTQECAPALIVPDDSLSLAEGAVKLKKSKSAKKQSWNEQQVQALVAHFKVSEEVPFAQLPAPFREALFYGTADQDISMSWGKGETRVPYQKPFEGLCRQVERYYRESSSEAVRRSVAPLMLTKPCRSCGGQRLSPTYLAVKLGAHQPLGIQEFCEMTVEESLEWLEGFSSEGGQAQVCQQLKGELQKRIQFLVEVGLGYLTLNRASGSLSGGEAQRIRLASQLGAGLSGVMYVLDEPSIGLHPADVSRLIDALKRLRDLGNTVILVEHDEEVIRAADWIVDMGPKAGAAGGEVLAMGELKEILAQPASITGKWLQSSKEKRKGPLRSADSEEQGSLVVRGARAHHLKNLTVSFPLGKMTCVSGPSGSGKSTLIHHVLRPYLQRQWYRSKVGEIEVDSVEGWEPLQRLIVVDQSPLGKSPRSNPATYTGLFDHMRKLYAQLPLSRQRGYQAGRFSFNKKGGRCEACEGAGQLKVDMHFLADVYIPCESCQGARYNRETLEVSYRGRSIADVMKMTAEEALIFFAKVPKIQQTLKALVDVGVGYLELGQAANTLSGGEAQRVKIACELAKPMAGKGLYLFDEPTTGLHHADVEVLLMAFHRLRDAGHTLLIIEHHLEVLSQCDHVIDLGPGGGKAGGSLVGEGSPSEIMENPDSLTGVWLRSYLSRYQ